jgi:NTF2-related export protein 1/2
MKCSLLTVTRYQVRFPQFHVLKTFLIFEFSGAQPPSLLITVSGQVTHGPGPSANPPTTHPREVEGHPRVFSQTFILVPDPMAPPTKPGEVAKYYVVADALRFVG